MAIDNMQGKVTTTGMMDKGPAMPKAPKLILSYLHKKRTSCTKKTATC